MDLIKQVNETATDTQAQTSLVESNILLMAQKTETSANKLVETAVTWLMKKLPQGDEGKQAWDRLFNPPEFANSAEATQFEARRKQTMAVMGALIAISDKDMAESMNINDKKRSAILKIADSSHEKSGPVEKYLMQLGMGEAKGYTTKVAELVKANNAKELLSMLMKAKSNMQMSPAMSQEKPAEKGQLGLAQKMREPATI